MIVEYINNHVFMSSIILVGAVSIFAQWLMMLSLKGYVKASANMKTTKKKVMVNLKNQFEAMYEMNSQVHNMDAYVDKYLLKLRFVGMPYQTWEKIPFLTAGIVSLLAVIGAFNGYLNKAESSFYVEMLFAYGITLACLFVFFHIFGIKMRKQQIHIQLVDYLENYLANRLNKSKDSHDETVVQSDAEEDMDMLKRLIREMDERKEKESMAGEVAAASEELSDIELLEEFVQSFLA